MAISASEFQVAMETFGAKRICNTTKKPVCPYVLCYEVENTLFTHFGSDYVVNDAPDTVINEAMAELNEKYPDEKNFGYAEIHSLKGLLTVVCMLENRYTKDLVEKLINETYKKLLTSELIRKNTRSSNRTYENPFMKKSTAMLMAELYKLVDEFDNIVNPFANSKILIREPKDYMNKIIIDILLQKLFASVWLSTKLVELKYIADGDMRNYSATNYISHFGGFMLINHYFESKYTAEGKVEDEIIHLRYMQNKNFQASPNDINLKISLKTGMAWKTYGEENAKIATDIEIESMVRHLKKMIVIARKEIINNMLIQAS